jgi:hypothetical protein
MSKQEIYFLDTINATRNYDSIIAAVDANSYHSFNVSFPFKYPLKNLKSIALKSVEMPLNLYTLRPENGSCKLGLTFTYSTYTDIYLQFDVNDGIYTTISSLITKINTAITAQANFASYTGLNITFGTLSVFGTNVCSITNNCTSLTIDETPFSKYILGYTNRFKSTSSQALTSNSPINLTNIDTCIYLQLPNLPNTNNTNLFAGFKLPTNNVANNTTLFYNDSEEHQSITFNNTSFILDKINIVVSDRLNIPLTGYFNWTMSLIIEHDDNTQQFLNYNN